MLRTVSAGARGAARSLLLSSAALAAACAPALAQQPAPTRAGDPLTVVVTPLRTPTAIQRVGSAVTVIREDEIARTNAASVVDALRGRPGVDVAADGGPGGVTSLRLRGVDASRTLVLVDGVRVNDPTTPGAQFDFATIPVSLIERIEILRGPQSALYGSDAIGGVVAIFTKRGGGGPPTVAARVEGGSYGTLLGEAAVSGGVGSWRYAFGLNGLKTDGFSAVGHRIDRIESRFAPLEDDGLWSLSGFGRIGFDAGEGVRFDLSAISSAGEAQYDSVSFPLDPNRPNVADRSLTQLAARAEVDAFEGRLTHVVEGFAQRSSRVFESRSFLPGGGVRIVNRDSYRGDRYGGEYQARTRLGLAGDVILGARFEREEARFREAGPFRGPPADYAQTTTSLFGLWQVPLGERIDVSLGGRIDDVSDSRTFRTWRGTLAYRIPETGTTLRGSVGTGAKAPSLFQRFSQFGNLALRPERSFGYDVGIDQSLLDGRVSVSVTAFHNRLEDLIDFQGARYFNVRSARTRGVEGALDAILVEDFLSVRASYTYLEAEDGERGGPLNLRPRHAGRVAFTLTPTAAWTIEPSIALVSARPRIGFGGVRLDPDLHAYARLDVLTSYRVNANLEVYARVENATDARYEEARDYGVTGRAFYAGLRATW